MSVSDGAGTSKAAMSIEDKARAANITFWEVASQHEVVECQHEHVAASVGHNGDDEQEGYEDYRIDEAEEEDATTSNGGNHTTDGGDHTTDGGDRTDGGSSNLSIKKKKPWKDWKPQKLTDTTNEITL